MRITIVDPSLKSVVNAGAIGNRIGIENIGMQYLISFLQSKGHKAVYYRTDSLDVPKAIQAILNTEPEMVALGPYTYNFPFATDIAAGLKSSKLDLPIAFGNVHASMAPESVPEEICDYIIKGEGEEALIEVVNALEAGDKLSRVVEKPRIEHLDALPSPYREERLLKAPPLFFHPPGIKHPKVAIVVGSRGCPVHCPFCVTPCLYGDGVTTRSPENIIAEMDELLDHYGEDLVFHFADPLFNSKRPWFKRLCQKMEDSPRQYYSIVLCDFAKLDKDLIRKMKRAGIYWILFGVETFDDLERKQFGKRRHIVDDILKICYEEGMLTRAFVMLGIPGTTEEKLRKQKEQLYEKPFISNLRINFYTPFPGTPLWKEVKDKNILLTEKWEHFTTEEPTIACDVTPDKLKTFSEELVREYYSSDKYKKGIAWQIQHYPEIEEVYADAFALIDDPFPV